MKEGRDKISASEAGVREGVVSVMANAFLFGLKMWAGVATGSVAIVADAWHTLSDSLSSIVVIAASRVMRREPDSRHPFGYGRWEQIASIFIGCMLGIVAYGFAKESLDRLNAHAATHFGTLATAVTLISTLSKEALAQYAFYLGRKSGNAAVRADGWHHRSDALSSLAVLVGIIFANDIWWADAAMGLIVSAMLFHATYKILRETVEKLLGQSPSPEISAEINRIASDVWPAGLDVHHIHLHNYVSHTEMTLHIKLDGDLTLSECHEVATRLERAIRKQMSIETTIHIEPKGQDHECD